MALDTVAKDKTLSEKAYGIIRNAITSNELKPGEIMVEEALAEQLAISRTPIRAALKRLQFEGILRAGEGKNLVVADVTKQDVSQVGVVRQDLEVLAVSLLKGQLTSERLAHLRDLEARHWAAARGVEGYMEYLDLDYEFHVTLARYTGNEFLAEMVEKVNFVTRRFLTLSGTLEKYSVTAINEHAEILKALEEGNLEEACRAMRAHIQGAYARMLVH